MRIEHIAIWCKDLELMKNFYVKYFQAIPNHKYQNPSKKFASYFLRFEDGARLELMQMESVPESKNDIYVQFTGLIHFAVSLGSKEMVDSLTLKLQQDGYTIIDGARTTGDDYYESVLLDPEQNRIELTI